MSDIPIAVGLSRLHFPVTALGPGKRIGIWFQGCSIRCSGCISADTWTFAKATVAIDEVLASIKPWLSQADGITISGGEPFDQVAALEALLRLLRLECSADILVFSGYSFEAIGPHLERLSGLIDAIVTDPFVRSTAQTRRLRGSDNQRLFPLTQLGRRRFANYDGPRGEQDRRLDIAFEEGGAVWFAGIPDRGDLARLRELLEADGHRVATSEDKSCR
ncbi:4Fe-4S cluster-binding domain-containing protein [Hyphomicrobium sp. MC1]|uniref:4Fe-4S cluster-binding domain-containing protein n=1 Tax=Hyphomicrobium sp. (strain MC1) TaxID=717785 RepID=UPI000213E909|nr:4Fe-4S cluster-binding domain-containing protein [Hyphomicrobium sp. MC1]CCB66565.1 Organic radical activating enzyme family protein [Hyphomicrobium sp. MC1]